MTELLRQFDPAKTPNNYWFALLSDGTYVYEDQMFGQLSTWHRLAQFLKETKLKISCLSLVANGVLINTATNAEGYFHTKSLQNIIGFYEEKRYAVGHVRDGKIQLVWINENGSLKEEERTLKTNDPAVILNQD